MPTLLLPHIFPPRASAARPLSVPPAIELSQRLSVLYALAQGSHYVFGSPLGPVYHQGLHHHLPRFVYFGPGTHNESLRLAFFAGFDHSDLRSSFALAHLVEQLALSPDLGHGLNLSFFPMVDAIGLHRRSGKRLLAAENWASSQEPEIELLAREARLQSFHGFVRIETVADVDEITVRLNGVGQTAGVELVSSDDFEPLPVRWEGSALDETPSAGPLSLADDLPLSPFELSLQVPARWSDDLYRVDVSSFLKRFVVRYRELQAFSHNL